MKFNSLSKFLLKLFGIFFSALCVFTLVPMFSDYVTDGASFGCGVMFCMFADILFAFCNHYVKLNYDYIVKSKSANTIETEKNNDNA